MNIAEKLRKLREEKGLSQEQLIDGLYKEQGEKIAISSVRNYENEKSPRVPQGTILLSLARFYNVSVEYLLDDNISAKSINNVSISRELGLSDKSIETIKKLNKKFNRAFNVFLDSDEGYYFLYDYFTNIYISIIQSKLYRICVTDINKDKQELNKNKKVKTFDEKKYNLDLLLQIEETLKLLKKFVQKYLFDLRDITISTQFVQLVRNTNFPKQIDKCIKMINEIKQKLKKNEEFNLNKKIDILMQYVSEFTDNIRLFNTLSRSLYKDDLIELSSQFLSNESFESIIKEIKCIEVKEDDNKIKYEELKGD